MTISSSTLYLIIIIWSLTLGRSILIMFGKKVFVDAGINAKSASYPILNLFSMLEIADISSYLGILLFIPVVNLLVLMLMSLKLGKAYNCESGFLMGLVFLPIVFYPSLFNSTRSYKNKTTDTFRALDSIKSENINLMTDSEIKAQNDDSPYALDPAVDSIFKSHADTMEPVSTYKANKIDQDVLDKLKDLTMDDSDYSPIKRQENVSYFETQEEDTTSSEVNNNNEQVHEEKKDDIVEFIDL